jgi:hypothetical protein
VSNPIDVAIQATLLTALRAFGAANSVLVSYPYIPFTPTVGVPYIDARPMLRAAPQSPGIGFAGSTLFRGIFQIDAVAPDGAGEAPGLRLAEQIRAAFPSGTVLTANGCSLRLNKVPTIAAAVKDAPWVRFPVSIPYLLIS